jgi:hypothetical protein
MEEYLIFAAIGGLLFLTLLVNSVSEAYEQNKRDKRIRILKIKQGLDELSNMLEQLKNCEINDGVRDLLLNEIMARLQVIQRIDRHFRGIQALIEEAQNEGNKNSAAPTASGFNMKDETEFKKKIVLLTRLVKYLNHNQWFSQARPDKLKQMADEVKLLRCEKIFQFYSNRATEETEQNSLLMAKERYTYILYVLKSSGINSNPRIIELTEQATFMKEQINQQFNNNVRDMINGNNPDETAGEAAEQNNVQSNV